MAGNFTSPDGDLASIFVDDYAMIDQAAATGSLWLYGFNNYGQLGDSTVTSKSSPVQTVAGGTNWKSLGGGYRHQAGIQTDGSLWLWGRNNYGQIGNNASGSTVKVSTPTQLTGTWNQVAGGLYNTAAIKTDGTLWLWGYNAYGYLGDNTRTNKSSPIQTIAAGNNWKQVSVGYIITAAVKTDGTLWTWGYNPYGGLGNNTTAHKSSPIQTVSGGTNWKSVSCYGYQTVAIKTDGTLWLWGSNNYGQLGDNTTTNKSSPVQTVAGGTNWKLVSSGIYHISAIKTDGTLWSWGYNQYGQLGDNTTAHKSSPVQTIAGGTNWKQVSSGAYQITAVKTDGTLWGWGYNFAGGLGDNTVTSKSSPVQTVAGGTNWKLVGSGGYNGAAIYFYDASNQYPSA